MRMIVMSNPVLLSTEDLTFAEAAQVLSDGRKLFMYVDHQWVEVSTVISMNQRYRCYKPKTLDHYHALLRDEYLGSSTHTDSEKGLLIAALDDFKTLLAPNIKELCHS